MTNTQDGENPIANRRCNLRLFVRPAVRPESSSGVSKRPLPVRDHQRGLKRPLADLSAGAVKAADPKKESKRNERKARSKAWSVIIVVLTRTYHSTKTAQSIARYASRQDTAETRTRARTASVPSAVQPVIMRVNALSAIRAKRIMPRTNARASSVRIARNTDTRRSSVPKSPRLRAMHAVPVRIKRQGRSIVLSTNARRAKATSNQKATTISIAH